MPDSEEPRGLMICPLVGNGPVQSFTAVEYNRIQVSRDLRTGRVQLQFVKSDGLLAGFLELGPMNTDTCRRLDGICELVNHGWGQTNGWLDLYIPDGGK